MMKFEGEHHFQSPPSEVWNKLSDVRFLMDCLPGAEDIEELREDHGICKQRPGFSFVKGVLHLTVDRVEAIPGQALKFLMFSKGVGSSSDVESVLTFTRENGGTKVVWKAEVVKLGGLLKAVPQGLIRGAAHKVIQEVWENVFARFQKAEEGES